MAPSQPAQPAAPAQRPAAATNTSFNFDDLWAASSGKSSAAAGKQKMSMAEMAKNQSSSRSLRLDVLGCIVAARRTAEQEEGYLRPPLSPRGGLTFTSASLVTSLFCVFSSLHTPSRSESHCYDGSRGRTAHAHQDDGQYRPSAVTRLWPAERLPVFVTSQQVTIGVDAIVTKIDARGVVASSSMGSQSFPPSPVSQSGQPRSETTRCSTNDGDFVLLGPRDGARLMDVVQIHRLRNLDVVVRRLHRQASTSGFKHDRLLVPDREFLRIDRQHFKPIAKCSVSTLMESPSSWMSEATDFFVTEEGARLLRPHCEVCTSVKRQERRHRRAMEPLRGMEIMCGAGGLTLGLDLSGACETTFAMDADAHAVETFRRHHPHAKVSCVDAGDALRQAMSPNAENTLPRPGNVDVIAAGPPCQGFSRKNQTAARDAAEKDPRNLLATGLLTLYDSQTERWRNEHFKFERLDSDGYFKILTTKVRGEGSMLHPTQRRLLTVRECARAQGFPDWVDFACDTNLQEAYKQIGNAVPVPLGVAIGRSIVTARMKDDDRA
ncbi:hypothetical protein L1887_57286 [Cichorium endivia]|nr:hypothetical protein L1887_57286 [Cichorium endivia]